MLRKKNAFSKISKRHVKSSAISVLMSLILVSTPIYSDEMEMEEYIDYDSSNDSYDYSYEDYSYDDSSYDYTDYDSGYEESNDGESSEDTGESDEETSQSSNDTTNESEGTETETDSNNSEQTDETQKNNSTTTGVDESENTVIQESANQDMTMTTTDTNSTNDSMNTNVESTMNVQYEKGGQADTSTTSNKTSSDNTMNTTSSGTHTIDLTGDPITDMVSIVTNGLNELKEAMIKATDMAVETNNNKEETQTDTENVSSDEGETSHTEDSQIDLTNNEITEPDTTIKTDVASEDVYDPKNTDAENTDETNTENTDGEHTDDSETEKTDGEQTNESETENTDSEHADRTETGDTEQTDESQEGKTDSTGNNGEQKEDQELGDDNQIDLDPENNNGEKTDDEKHETDSSDSNTIDNTEDSNNEKPEEKSDDENTDNQIKEEELVKDKTEQNEQEQQKQQEQQEQQEIVDLIGENQQLIELIGNEDQEVVDIVKAIENGQQPYSEEELITDMVVNVIDLAEEIGTTTPAGLSYSYSYGGGYGYTPTSYTNVFNSQPHQQTREEWINSLTPYERMLTGMTRTEERPATVSADVNIYSGRSESNSVVGVLPTGGVCYILEDGEWAYVESGEVRGFIRASELSEGNIANNINVMPRAESMIDPNYNTAFNYLNITTSQIPEMPSNSPKKGIDLGDSISRNEVISYAMQTDTMINSSAGFVKDVYSHFGISLPDSTNDQSYVGERIDVTSVRPGDLIFYKENGAINDVLICIGDNKVVRVGETGKHVEDINFDKVCWATRLIPGATQAIEFSDIGQKAAAGDETARNEIIVALADAAEDEWNTYGFPRSVLIAEAIMESNWLSFVDAENGGMQPEDNNIMNMNEHLRNDEWESPWTGDMIQRNIPRYENGEIIYGNEMMRAYNDIESCFNDYAAFKTDQHPNIQGETDIDIIIEEGLQGYATDPDYQASIKRVIEQYDLTQFDNLVITGAGNYTDSTNYTQDQLELIWAITAQEDDTSYEGALAVISTAMNRADQNYGGHGMDALSQLTADGQFCYSPSVSDPIYYQRRLNGNVPEFVKQAVYDCLENGVRNHTYLNFRSSNRTGNYTQIGGNWFF